MCIFAAIIKNMTNTLQNLEPANVWRCFANINSVPRPSKKEEKIIRHMLDFGLSLGLDTYKDPTGNVIITKPATTGMEHRKPVILQSHLDMVHQKNAATRFDFETEGIQMFQEGDWVKAKGTTLGADNGMGVAAIMAILESETIAHPRLEALFTIDEETGMTGAKNLEGGRLKGQILLNLDTEEDDEVDVGCAGGVDITATCQYNEELPENTLASFCITVKGLQGGHSGIDIHRGLGNANKIMNQLLCQGMAEHGLRVASIDGGGLRNAIPRESKATVAVPLSRQQSFEQDIKSWAGQIKSDLSEVEPALQVDIAAVPAPAGLMDEESQKKVLKAITDAHNGVYSMSREIEGLVESSNNIARVEVGGGKVLIGCLARSSEDHVKLKMATAISQVFEKAGMTVKQSGEYPGWSPNPDSAILKVFVSRYESLFGNSPKIVACHAGLECGILGNIYPGLDMISFGPTIKGAHSPDERVQISSVRKFWALLIDILQHIPPA